MKNLKLFNSTTIFYFLTITIGVISISYLFINHEHSLNMLLFVDRNDSFMDFFNPIFHSYSRNPYIAVDRIYPAFCYVFYWCLSRFIPPFVLAENNGFAIRASQEGLLIFSVYMTVLSILIFVCLFFLRRGSRKERIVFCIVTLLSAPFIFEYERANIIMVALICTILFFVYKDSEDGKLHEAALLFLCIAASIKIYPAIFGMLLLRDRKWKDILHCLTYGIVLFLFPFHFMGGMSTISTWVRSLSSGASNTLSVVQGVGYKTNFSNVIVTLYGLTHDGVVTEESIQIGSKVAGLLAVAAIIAFCIQKTEWKQQALLTGILIGLPGFSFQYSMIFMVIPLAFFLEGRRYGLWNSLYSVLFSLMFSFAVLPNGRLAVIQGNFPLTTSVFLEEISLFLMVVLLIVDTLITLLSWRGRVVKKDILDDGNDSKLVSICIPVYNGEKTIEKTLKSAMNQSYTNTEIIVVDNCSKDKTVEIVRQVSASNVRLYQNSTNLGMVGNWNKCLEHSKGEYVTILCADDILERDSISRRVKLMNVNKDVVMCFSDTILINENEKVLAKREFLRGDRLLDGKELALKSYYTRNIYGEPSNVLFEKAIVKDAGPFDKSMYYSADWDMWLRISERGNVGYIAEPLMKYRISSSNQTSKTKIETYIKDDMRMIGNIHKTGMNISLFDDVIHFVMYCLRMLARIVYLKVKV